MPVKLELNSVSHYFVSGLEVDCSSVTVPTLIPQQGVLSRSHVPSPKAKVSGTGG